MPILRQEIQAFARMWNCHTIRKQPNRPNAIHGKPYMLYNWPQAPGVQKMGLKPDAELLSQLEEQTAAHDLNEYLPEITKKWCDAELEKLGYGYTKVNASEYFPDGTRAHCSVYLQLRATVQAHIASKKEPCLSKSKKPEGAWNWNAVVSTANVRSTDIPNEGEDSLATPSDFVENLEDLEDLEDLENLED